MGFKKMNETSEEKEAKYRDPYQKKDKRNFGGYSYAT
jgi:hypothetical protein